MAPGEALSRQVRALIARRLFEGASPRRIVQVQELNPNGDRHGLVSLLHMQRLAFMRRMRPAAYLSSLGVRTGRKQFLLPQERRVLKRLSDEDDSATLGPGEPAAPIHGQTGIAVGGLSTTTAALFTSFLPFIMPTPPFVHPMTWTPLSPPSSSHTKVPAF